MNNLDKALQAVKRIDDSPDLVDIMLGIEDYLDRNDLYAFKNWIIGELVSGPEISKYRVTCIFMWPEKLMPDPRGARRLLPFDCKVRYMKKMIRIPVKIEDPSDYRPGTHKAKLIERPVWLVEITIVAAKAHHGT